MLPEVPFNHALTLFYLQNVTPVGQDLLQIRSYVYAEEPNIDIHNFVGTFTRVSKPRGAQGPARGARDRGAGLLPSASRALLGRSFVSHGGDVPIGRLHLENGHIASQ